MPQKLTDMIIDEISLVDEPANDSARVVIVKAKTDPAGIAGDPDAADAVAAHLKEQQMDIENLSKALEDAEAKLDALEKRADDAEAQLKDAGEVIKQRDAQIASLTEEVSKAKAKKQYAKEEDEEEEEDEAEVMKSLPASIRKRLEEAKAAQEEVAKMKAEKDEAEAIAKAKAIGVGDPAVLGPLLMRVAKGSTTADDAATLEGIFKSLGEVQKGHNVLLFKSLGSSAAVDGEPEAVLKAKADEIFKSAAGKLTKEQAYAKAMDENPGLYQAYIAKRRSA